MTSRDEIVRVVRKQYPDVDAEALVDLVLGQLDTEWAIQYREDKKPDIVRAEGYARHILRSYGEPEDKLLRRQVGVWEEVTD